MTQPPKPLRTLPGRTVTIDMATGEEKVTKSDWHMLPAPPGHCPICYVDHGPGMPHTLASLPYQMAFVSKVERPPTWADAIAHCEPWIQARVREVLEQQGKWSEPPEGTEPVKHLGLEDEA